MEKILAKKTWQNASAFIEMEDNGNVIVYGKWNDGFRNHPGPMTDVLDSIPEELMSEAREFTFRSTPSAKLQQFIDAVWQKAQQSDSWFSYC